MRYVRAALVGIVFAIAAGAAASVLSCWDLLSVMTSGSGGLGACMINPVWVLLGVVLGFGLGAFLVLRRHAAARTKPASSGT